ncbi:MAG: hypothetical protein RRC34_15995 [Lentisphaeria bacterium]|nr:hypothetical protein [Lentisphaeria bacterium]
MSDPFQMNNLADNPARSELRERLEAKLQSQLEARGDRVMSKEKAVEQWGYTVNATGEIPYRGEFQVQSPGVDKGVIRWRR